MATKMSFAFEEAHRLLVELINMQAIFRIITNYNYGGHRKRSVQFDWFVFHMYVLQGGGGSCSYMFMCVWSFLAP